MLAYIGMHFSLKNKPENILDNHFVTVALVIAFIAFFVGISFYENLLTALILSFFIICGVVAFLIKEYRKKAFQEFDVNDQGILCKNKTYYWTDIKNYHWWGEKQSERLGAVRTIPIINYDPINPYKYSKDQILCLHMGIWKNINLQVDFDKVDVLASFMEKNGIKHVSRLQKILGY